MAYKPEAKEKIVKITPYNYWGMESGFKDKKVFVIKGDESPDPAKKMMWGRTCQGNVLSDYKRGFTKFGTEMEVKFSTSGFTAMEEKKDMLKAVDSYIKQVCEIKKWS